MSPNSTEPNLSMTFEHSLPLLQSDSVRSRVVQPARKSSCLQAGLNHLKVMFGAGAIALPNVLSSTGLPLGIAAYLIVLLSCTFTIPFLFDARAIAENDHKTKTEFSMRSLPRLDEESASRILEMDNSLHSSATKGDFASHLKNNSVGNKSRPPMKEILTYDDLAEFIAGPRLGFAIRVTVVMLYLVILVGFVIVIQDVVKTLMGSHVDSDNMEYIVGFASFIIMATPRHPLCGEKFVLWLTQDESCEHVSVQREGNALTLP